MPDRPPPALAVVIPALDAGAVIGRTLDSLGDAEPDLEADIVVVDGSSADDTLAVCQRHGARTITAPPGRGGQLAAGAAATRAAWLLFLHADTVLEPGWAAAVARFVARPANARRAAYFRLAFDDAAPAARRLERLAGWRSRALGLPYGDQGLLIARDFYRALGGYRALPLMEDVDLVRRIGRRRLTALPATALTSAERYRRSGYLRRPARNLLCLTLYFLGVPPRLLRRLYG